MTEAEKNYLFDVGRNIAKLRRQHGFSQLDICVQIDMEKSNLSSIENGRQNFTALTLLKIAEAIGVGVHEFFQFTK
ncbi:helix-turn-helix domain-containing protein [Altibacter sp. HG106]|uniref:helix-turn-helix domain-containing protein n=1 Tax=Altibacter sp. HG106 TaxID=3023937 RepID=UPI002350C0D4|nr:helix-turn-helix transcriptional regulator [Altibacter sp. HG106]MDC7994032.1 helix-turn-helix transcriptional regulator [Altibacter sp. HG106]